MDSASGMALLNGPTSVFAGLLLSCCAIAKRKNVLYCALGGCGAQYGAPIVVNKKAALPERAAWYSSNANAPIRPAAARAPMSRVRLNMISSSKLGGSCLQFSLELVQKTPIGPLRDHPLRTGLDHPYFMQPKGMEPNCVFRICLAPAVVRQGLQHLQRDVILPLITF